MNSVSMDIYLLFFLSFFLPLLKGGLSWNFHVNHSSLLQFFNMVNQLLHTTITL